ncbi:MAG: rbfA [Peptococcaceae bacterium]|jgi:ribosome-binding factor A|uniref:Ribosome-binding factor A n=1 Tax=Thermanaerosceptrum fracticalcis TaxID=1712410 RepID=A0A7G6E0W9_THEFR|nr:30S ribosome-binding factor RbfA [Thermanaerosceptrum fracticalcis]MBZ4654477.1 rbfA [Peptococcaceae bacterium]QNB45723.1 30S ribosome-binding factor RbfA [Thermanaerosceptrum fracticalcis]
MAKHRISRIAEEIKREVAQMIRDEIKDPRITGLISVTQVEVTNDLSIAKIYISLLGDEEKRKSCLQGLEKACGYIRTELAKRLKLRYTPELVFKMDESIEYGAKISKILAEVNKTGGDLNSDV